MMRYSLTTLKVEADEEAGTTNVSAVNQPGQTVLVAYNTDTAEGLLAGAHSFQMSAMPEEEGEDPPPPPVYLTRSEAVEAFIRITGREPSVGELP